MPKDVRPDVAKGPGGLAAVVLTGGTATRMGGADKAGLEVGGVPLLEHAIAAAARAEEVVVVGDPVPTSRPVTWARESPAGGGPAAGLLAGVDALRKVTELVLVLAVDMPRVTASTVARLVSALDVPADAAVLLDAAGRRQLLAGVYRYDALASARPSDRGLEHGLSVRDLTARLSWVGVPEVGDEGRDVDTWDDLRDLGP